jgi:tetratricopeptide (TPR) repeat protein
MPSVGLCLAIALALMVRLPSWRFGPKLSLVAAPALALLAIFWVSQTWADIPIWKSDTALMMRVRARAPNAAWPHVAQGDILRFQEGDLDGSEREYQTALRLGQNPDERSPEVIYDAYIGLGGVALERRQDQQALMFYQQAANTLPQLSPAYDFMGAYYFPRKDYATASLYFTKAVKANPQDVEAHVYLGNCWMKMGRFKDAAEEFHEARDVDPSLKQGYISEAHALEVLGEVDAAAKVRQSIQ